MSGSQRKRLDQLMVDSFGYESRSRARDAVKRGCVFLDGRKLTRPGQELPIGSLLQIDDPARRYVSRAALKLIQALNHEDISVDGRVALDLGASTGGFSQVLLERGAKQVYAIDVGSGQLHACLRDNPAVVNLENLNVRDLSPGHLDNNLPEMIVSDLSFISLKLALPSALELAAPNAWGIFLIKPQFEVGREHLGRGGIVRDEEVIEAAVKDIVLWTNRQGGWSVVATIPSPIEGGDGNREFLMIARKAADNA